MITRRGFLTTLASAGLSLPLLRGTALALRNPTAVAPAPALARPTSQQLAWQDLELGMFIHFAPNTWQEREYDDRSTPLSAINPAIDTDQWADCAATLGAKYIVFVAKHAGGFCMWQTDSTDYSIRNTPWRGRRGDVMADLAASCQRRGLKLGLYLSPQDGSFGAAGGGKCSTPQKQRAYNALYRRQLTELLTRYGPLAEIWFDGSIVVPVGDILARHAPDAMVFQGPHATIRWVGNEDGFAPPVAWNSIERTDAMTGIATAAHGDPGGQVWLPNEVDVSVRRPNWFWSTKNESNLLSLEALLEIYYRSVGHGAQLLLNFPPDRRGLISDSDFGRAREFGREIERRFAKSVAETSGRGSSFELHFPTPTRVDHAILQEDIATGERVREFRIEGGAGGVWIPLGRGTAIGHKRIQPLARESSGAPRSFDALRLIVERSAATPILRRFAAFDTGAVAPANWSAAAPVWADDDAGHWRNSAFEMDLTKRIKAPGAYRLRLVANSGEALQIHDAQLLFGGVPQRGLVKLQASRDDVLLLSIPRFDPKIVLSGRVSGPDSGIALLRKLSS